MYDATLIEDFHPDIFDESAFNQVANELQEKLPVTVKEYLEDARIYIGDINQGLATNNAEQVDCGSHPLKSNSLSFGLVSVSKVAELINEIAVSTNRGKSSLEQARVVFPLLEDSYVHAQEILRLQLKQKGF